MTRISRSSPNSRTGNLTSGSNHQSRSDMIQMTEKNSNRNLGSSVGLHDSGILSNASAPKIHTQRNPLYLALPVVALCLMILLIYVGKEQPSQAEVQQSQSAYAGATTGIQAAKDAATKPKTAGTAATMTSRIVSGNVAGVEYYHCPAAKAGSSTTKNMVLLHGMAFTKENWKETGIMDQFCNAAAGDLQVTALDLNVSVKHAELQNVLKALQQQRLVSQLPLTALITPSASGSAMVDWMRQSPEIVQTLPQYISKWIPVAANSLLSLQDDTAKIAALKQLPNFSILAIYGDRDAKGKQSSGLLGTYSGATVVELPGPHPVYMEVPTQFVEQVLGSIYS